MAVHNLLPELDDCANREWLDFLLLLLEEEMEAAQVPDLNEALQDATEKSVIAVAPVAPNPLKRERDEKPENDPGCEQLKKVRTDSSSPKNPNSLISSSLSRMPSLIAAPSA